MHFNFIMSLFCDSSRRDVYRHKLVHRQNNILSAVVQNVESTCS